MLYFVSHTIKHNDIAAMNVVQLVRHFVDKNAIFGHQGRLHAGAIDVVLLEQEYANQHRCANGNHDDENPFPNSAHLRTLLLT